jgi:hypothetical protein
LVQLCEPKSIAYNLVYRFKDGENGRIGMDALRALHHQYNQTTFDYTITLTRQILDTKFSETKCHTGNADNVDRDWSNLEKATCDSKYSLRIITVLDCLPPIYEHEASRGGRGGGRGHNDRNVKAKLADRLDGGVHSVSDLKTKQSKVGELLKRAAHSLTITQHEGEDFP